MKFIQGIAVYTNAGFSRKLCSSKMIRTFSSTNQGFDGSSFNQSSSESAIPSEQRPIDQTSSKAPIFKQYYDRVDRARGEYKFTNPGFENRRINQSPTQFSNFSEQRPFRDTKGNSPIDHNSTNIGFDNTGKSPAFQPFYQHLDRAERDFKSFQGSNMNSGNDEEGLDTSINTLYDGMESKLKEAAVYFEYNPDEVEKDDYSFRKDVTFFPGNTYDTKDLDLRKRAVQKPWKRPSFQTTTKEVLEKADFRNVRFLANFITDAGIIIKRSTTGISAKAQRKVAREIKTARAFGLLPFTTMGTKQFVYGRTMENLDTDFAYESYFNNFVDNDPIAESLE